MLTFLRRNKFIVLVLIVFLLSDIALQKLNPVGVSTFFQKNDYEKIIVSEETSSFEKAFYGNSVVVSAFIQEDSMSGYHNIGMAYGTISDFIKMLDRDLIQIEDELVLGLNYFTLYDEMDTNPSYPWHQRSLEPYVYFQRDRIYSFLATGFNNILEGKAFAVRNDHFDRTVCYGTLEGADWIENITRHKENFWSLPITDFERNLAALDELASYCNENDIRLRVVWMPWNPSVPIPQIVYDVIERANEILQKYEIEAYNALHALPAEYFHDTAHLEYGEGAPYFTQWIDEWLIQ